VWQAGLLHLGGLACTFTQLRPKRMVFRAAFAAAQRNETLGIQDLMVCFVDGRPFAATYLLEQSVVA